MNPLFTIGHSAHTIEEFIELLKKHEIDAVADVRSQPYSRHYPWFSRDALEASLRSSGVRYVFLGKELGARRDERECYVGSAVDYDLIAKTPAFIEGVERIRKGMERLRIALMCAEKDPLDCHRTILVSRHVQKFGEVSHILADGMLESHPEAEARLLQKFKQDANDLFASPEEILEQAYERRGKEIAYVETNPNSQDA